MSEWASGKIGDFCIVGDGAHGSLKRLTSGVMYLTSKNFKGGGLDLSKVDYISQETYEKYFRETSKALTKPNTDDVLFSIIGTIGEPYLVQPNDCFGISSSVAILRPIQSEVYPRYLFYWIKGDVFQSALYSIKGGVAQGYVSLEMIRSLPLYLPSLPTQRRIAAILSAYDDLIENNTRRIQALEQAAHDLYREWFVEFRFPGHESVELVDSGTDYGMIPQGWKVGQLEDALVLQRGFDLPTRERIDGTVPIFASTGVTGFHNVAKVKAPGVVTGRSGSLGTVIFIDEDYWPLNTTLWVKEFRKATPLYAYYLLRSLGLENYNSGAAVPTLNRNYVHGLPVILPTNTLLELFNEYVLAMFEQMRILRKKNNTLREARDLLLPRLVSGQVDVSDIEVEIGSGN